MIGEVLRHRPNVCRPEPAPQRPGPRGKVRGRTVRLVPYLMSTFLVLGTAGPSAGVKLPAERDTVIMSAHRPNNDGSWGFGWIKVAQGTNRALLGFDLTPIAGRTDFQAARVILWAPQNNFRSVSNGGTGFRLHAFDPMSANSATCGLGNAVWPQGTTPSDFQWAEGEDRWDQFVICSNTEWRRGAINIPGYAGATWNCSADPDTSDNGDTSCGSSVSWVPPTAIDQLHTGFLPDFAAEKYEAAAGAIPFDDNHLCDFPALDPAGTGPKCDPTCGQATMCIKSDPTQPEKCFRRIVLELSEEEICRLKENIVAAAECTTQSLAACPQLHPSYLLKRASEAQSNGGGVHYFSREGAICILGGKDPSYAAGYAKLVPTLEVDLTGSPAVSDPQPVAHCDQFCEGPPNPNSLTCADDGMPPNVYPCPQGTCTLVGGACDCP